MFPLPLDIFQQPLCTDLAIVANKRHTALFRVTAIVKQPTNSKPPGTRVYTECTMYEEHRKKLTRAGSRV